MEVTGWQAALADGEERHAWRIQALEKQLEEAELQAEERGREALESIQALERQRDEATAGADAPIAIEKEAERASLLAKVVSLEAECESHLALCEAHAGKMKELEEQGGGQAARIKELEVPLA